MPSKSYRSSNKQEFMTNQVMQSADHPQNDRMMRANLHARHQQLQASPDSVINETAIADNSIVANTQATDPGTDDMI